MMKARLWFVLSALMLMLGSMAWAQSIPVLITVDENGNGVFTSPVLGSAFSQGVLAPDPGPGGLSSVLTYNLLGPPSLVPGDVFLDDGPGAGILDVIRFNAAGTGDPNYPASLLFYSDNVDGFDALADTPGPPTSFYDNFVVIPEVGPEGNNGAFYTPGANDPGFIAGFDVTYHFISDSPTVPEPGTLALVAGLGVSGLGLVARRRRR